MDFDVASANMTPSLQNCHLLTILCIYDIVVLVVVVVAVVVMVTVAHAIVIVVKWCVFARGRAWRE